MNFLLFDVKPHSGAEQRYLDIAAGLRPELDALGGCLFIDRFRSLDDPSWLLSFQIWRDEGALGAWREHGPHRSAQATGRREVFEDYRIRVGEVWGEQTAEDSAEPREAPEGGSLLVLCDGADGVPAFAGAARFASLYRPGRRMQVIAAGDSNEALHVAASLRAAEPGAHLRLCRVSRDYGMLRRDEAPAGAPR